MRSQTLRDDPAGNRKNREKPEAIPIGNTAERQLGKQRCQQVRELIDTLRDALNEIILPRILADRIGDVSPETMKEIRAGKIIDTRVPRFLSHSGKGGPDYPGYCNVTVFDHSTGVGVGGATFTALDYLAIGSEWALVTECSAVALVVGLMHDIDKLEPEMWEKLPAEAVAHYFEAYGIGEFLERFGVRLAADQFAYLIDWDETRRAHAGRHVPVPTTYIDVARRLVRFADKLESLWLADLPAASANTVVDAMRRAVSSGATFRGDVFGGYVPLIVSDPHHPFILAMLARCVEGACLDLTGIGPLFHVVRDETLVSLLPEESRSGIIMRAIEETVESLPFDSEILISSTGVPKISGSKPTWTGLADLVRRGVPTGGMRRLLSIKLAPLASYGAEFRDLAANAGCPLAEIPRNIPGQTFGIIAPQSSEAPAFQAVLDASLVSLAIGIEGETRRKDLSKARREAALVTMLGDPPDWLGTLDPLSRRTALALVATVRMREDEAFRHALLGQDGLIPRWFADNGAFSDMRDKASLVRRAVARRLREMCDGGLVDHADDDVTVESKQG
jgi:hypothetical protein